MLAETHSIAWDSKLGNGVPLMESDHHEMVVLINAVYAACDRHEWNDAVRQAMLDLSLFTVQHFQREENMMAATHYPHLAAHAKAHQKLIGYLDAISERIINDGPAAIDSETVDFLYKWLVKHARFSDRKLAIFLQHQPPTARA